MNFGKTVLLWLTQKNPDPVRLYLDLHNILQSLKLIRQLGV